MKSVGRSVAACTAFLALSFPLAASSAVDYLPPMPPASGIFGRVVAVPPSFNSGVHVDYGYPSGRENPYSYTMPSGLGWGAGDALDYHWVWVGRLYDYIVWSFEAHPMDGVRVYPSQDHGPYPTEFNEYDVWASDDRVNWERGVETALYTGSFVDCGYWTRPGCVMTHDGVKDFRFSKKYKFVWVRSTYDGDYEIDAVEGLNPLFVPVSIDIKPGSFPNSINLNGAGVIPVAILGSADFDVSSVVPATVRLASMAVKTVGKAGDRLLYSYEDVNGDGYVDLVLQIADQGGTLAPGDSSAELTGELLDGTPILGSDSINIVP